MSLMKTEQFDVFVIGDSGDNDLGLVGERILEHGGSVYYLDRDYLPDWNEIDLVSERNLMITLGSERSATAEDQTAVVKRESDLMCQAAMHSIPIMGICYGTQLLAQALGGVVKISDIPEFGILEAKTTNSQLCPVGPWAYLHYDTFDLPPGAEAFGRTPAGYTGFTSTTASSRVLGWQFHPEVNTRIMARWLDKVGENLRQEGFDTDYMYYYLHDNHYNLRSRTFSLVDNALKWLFEI